MTKKEIAAKLREALALMNDDGTHWVQGEYIEAIAWEDGDIWGDPIDFGYCSLGAIRHVTKTPVENRSDESDAVALALAKVLPQQPNEGAAFADPTEDVIALDRIVHWNDDSGRTWEQVVERFNEAAALTEQEE